LEKSWEENLKMLRRCEERRGPSDGIIIPTKQLSEWITQFTDILMRIKRVNAANMKKECEELKETYDSCTGGRFTYIADTAKRGHVNELLTNRMELSTHMPHPFHRQCHIRACGFGNEIPEELTEYMKTKHNYSENQLINEEMNTIVQIYGDSIGWEREETDEETNKPVRIIIEDNKEEQTIICMWPFCQESFGSHKEKYEHCAKQH
jgi:hypothetical protein